MNGRWNFLAVLLVLGGSIVLQGCSVESTTPADSITGVVESTPAVEIKTVETVLLKEVKATSIAAATAEDAPVAVASGASYGASGVGIVYQKVAAIKGMAKGKPFNVYTEAKAPDNHFTPSGWMGDYGDLKINDRYATSPYSGASCIQVTYSNKASQGARWAGIYWQNPANNWGSRPGGYDLTGAKKVTFWVRGEKGDERIEEFKVGGIAGEFGDTDVAGSGPVTLTKEWKQVTIDLAGKDLLSISGGFCWATNLDANPDGVTFYLDDIRYE